MTPVAGSAPGLAERSPCFLTFFNADELRPGVFWIGDGNPVIPVLFPSVLGLLFNIYKTGSGSRVLAAQEEMRKYLTWGWDMISFWLVAH